MEELEQRYEKIANLLDNLKKQLDYLSNQVYYGIGNNDEYYLNRFRTLLVMKNRIQAEEDKIIADLIASDKITGTY